MSNDNLKTWPEKIWAYATSRFGDHTIPYQESYCNFEFCSVKNKSSAFDVEYIRADVAREREKKLIAAAYHCADEFDKWNNLKNVSNDIYKEAGLEPLK